jgi:hypothetical protein
MIRGTMEFLNNDNLVKAIIKIVLRRGMDLLINHMEILVLCMEVKFSLDETFTDAL